MIENAVREGMKESNRLKEKACENCMEKLNGVLSDRQMQQFREAFYSASEGYMFQKSRDFPGKRKEPLENQAALVYNLIRK